jgi:hypothetical protein
LPDFRIIEGGGPDKEQREKEEQEREKQLAREWAENEFSASIREVAANMLRIIRGAGKPHALLMEMKQTIDTAVKFQETHGCWPSHVISNELALESQDQIYRNGVKEGRYTQEQVDRWLAEGAERYWAEHTIKCGTLQTIASDLLGQSTQRSAGNSEFQQGLRDWTAYREEKRRREKRARKRGPEVDP